MKYLVYLKRSFTRRIKRHATLYVILTCTIILPLIISIFRDSIIYGQKLSVQDATKGQTYHILNAKEEYLPYFENIAGLSSYYEDDTIFIRIVSESEAADPEKEDEYDAILSEIAYSIGDDHIVLTNVAHMGEDISNDMFTNQLLIVNIVIIGISLLIIQSVYRYHLKKFIAEVGSLRSLGATKRHIMIIFFAEYLVLFVLSSLTAVVFTSTLMKVLFDSFLQIKDMQNLAWMVYHVDIASIILHLAVFFAVISVVIILTLRYISEQPIITLLHANTTGDKLQHYKGRLKISGKAASSLAHLFLKRTNVQFVSCLVVSIPIMLVFIFVFNYIAINISVSSVPPEYEIILQKAERTIRDDWSSMDTLESIKRLDGVETVKQIYRTQPTRYLVKDDRMIGPSQFEWGNDLYATTSILSYQYVKANKPDSQVYSSKFNVAVSANHAYLKYKVGDRIILQPSESDTDSAGAFHFADPITLTVVEVLDLEWTDRMFAIYMNDALFQELMQGETVNQLRIKLNDVGKHKDVEASLRTMYNGPQYTILNEYEVYEKVKTSTIGLYIMFLCLFGIMLAFVLLILYMKLSDYINMQYEIIRSLHVLGASKKDLLNSYMKQCTRMSTVSILVSCVLGYGLLLLFFKGTGYHLVLNATTVSIQLLVIALIAVAFIRPVYAALLNKLRTLY